MSTKPTIALARWADQVGANVVEPTSGERDTGFQAGTPAASGKVNALWFHHYEWARWLDDGDCAFHNLSATGTFGVTGATTLTGSLTASGGIIVPTGQAVALNGNTTLTVGTGAVTFGGIVNANAGIAVPTGQAVTLSGSTTLSVGSNATVGGTLGVTGASTLTGGIANNVTLSAGATLASGQDLHHGTRTLPLTSAAFVGSGTTASYGRGSVTLASTSGEALFASIPLAVGRRITAIRVFVHDATIGPSTVTATFFSVTSTGTVSVIGSATSAGNNTDQTLTIGSLTTTIAASTSYGIEVKETSASGTTVTIYMAEVDYDRP